MSELPPQEQGEFLLFPTEEATQILFQTVQNKLHYAVSGKTAPELIMERADHEKPNMGVTTFKGKVVRKADVTVAKNYLNEEEISELNRLVTMFLDYAEDQAKRRKQVFLKDWQERLDAWLGFNERRVLPGLGTVSREAAVRDPRDPVAAHWRTGHVGCRVRRAQGKPPGRLSGARAGGLRRHQL